MQVSLGRFGFCGVSHEVQKSYRRENQFKWERFGGFGAITGKDPKIVDFSDVSNQDSRNALKLPERQFSKN
jgi:hypothetical protein